MSSLIIPKMTWSYSRISAYNACPYKFFLTYIKPCRKVPLFFSGYGSFIHELLASYYGGQKSKEQVVREYLLFFRAKVKASAPEQKIFDRYFHQGLTHLKALSPLPYKILGVEKEVHFQVGAYPFVGYIDLLMQDHHDGSMMVWDHKSHALKQRSTRGKYTKSDKELDNYLKQLYLYSIPVKEQYEVLPKSLIFNCYRTGEIIREPFSLSAFHGAKEWALSSIERITKEDDWAPNMEYYYCKHICDVHDSCEYYAMQYGISKPKGYRMR